MSSAPSSASHPLDAAIFSVSEFPERLGPVLIKELRQGLRSGLFVTPFLVLPVVLAIVAVWALAINNVANARQGVAFFYWCAVCIPVLVLTPMRGLGAIRSERDAQTLDLLQLTPLSAWRIIFAKWSSLFVQSTLWVVALLPFLVLRYFFGGMSVADELLALASVVVTGALLTSLTLLVSTFPRVMFWVGIAGLLFLGAMLLVGFANAGPRGVTRAILFASPGSALGVVAVQALLCVHLTWLALVFGASRIAPPADNYAARQRLGVLGLFVWYALAAAFLPADIREARLAFLFTGVLALNLLTACEMASQQLPLVAHLRPWARSGRLGTLIASAFVPGWPSAWLFNTVVTGGVIAITLLENQEEVVVPAMLVWLAVMLPRGVQLLFTRGPEVRGALHLLLHITGGIVAAVLGPFSFALRDVMVFPAAVFPSSLLWLTLTEVIRERHYPAAMVAASAWIIFLSVLFLLKSRGYWREASRCARAARNPATPMPAVKAPAA